MVKVSRVRPGSESALISIHQAYLKVSGIKIGDNVEIDANKNGTITIRKVDERNE